jgi:ABC-type nitrate/sulfonate/bicarbonate transport system ATPase subunit
VLIGCHRRRAGEEKGAARERQVKTHRQKLAKIFQGERALPWKSVSAILAARPIKDETKQHALSNPRASRIDESKEPQTEKEK